MTKKVLVAMSGGVDSSVAAFVMKKEYSCAGAIMRMFNADTEANQAERLTARLAERLDIPFYVLDCTQDFNRHVISAFISSYRRGETPNPCIECNKHLKFGKFLSFAAEQGYSDIATGHYARIEYDGSRFLLKKGRDSDKDQSYVLYMLTQQELSRTHFPLGSLTKSEVREIAAQNDFENAKQRESQDICFIPNGDYAAFIERTAPLTNGNFITADGKIICAHKGFERYTIGQRRGLGLSLPAPLYVCGKKNGDVLLGSPDLLMKKSVIIKDINLIACGSLSSPIRVAAKTRYRQREMAATAEQTDSSHIRIEFDAPVRAAAPGQSAVMYDGDTVIGGGIITEDAI